MKIHGDIRKPIFQEALDSKGEKVSIFDVPNGNNANCFCPICKEPVGAKNKGKTRYTVLEHNQKEAHFYHRPDSNCNYNGESLLHKLAKEVFAENLELMLPSPNPNYENIFGKGQLVKFEDVFIEERIYINCDYFQIDAIAIKNKKVVLIEFVNTSYVDNYKANSIINKRLNCIEIYLDCIPEIENIKDTFEIKKKLINFFRNGDSYSFEWIFNCKLEDKVNKDKLNILIKKEKIKRKFSEIEKDKAERKELKDLDDISEDDLFLDYDSGNDLEDGFLTKNNYNYNEGIEDYGQLKKMRETLLKKGYRFLKIYRNRVYDYGESYNGKSFKAFSHFEENIYCPLRKSSLTSTISLSNCGRCNYHDKLITNENDDNCVVCGLYKL